MPLETKDEFLKTKVYTVRPISEVLFRPHLVTPPPFDEPPGNAKAYWVLNEDLYHSF